MTYKQREHVVSLLTKLGISLIYLAYVVLFTDFAFATISTQGLARVVFGFFVAQMIAQTIVTVTHSFFANKEDRIADERDKEIVSRADQIGGYVLGVFMMIGMALVAFGKSETVLLYTLGVGGLMMGLVSDCLRIYGYRK